MSQLIAPAGVESEFVLEPEHWKYSSAIDYAGGKGLLEINYV